MNKRATTLLLLVTLCYGTILLTDASAPSRHRPRLLALRPSASDSDFSTVKTVILTEAHIRAVITDPEFIDNSNVTEYLSNSPLSAQDLIMALERSLDDYIAYVLKPARSAMAASMVEMKWNTRYKKNILGALAKDRKDILIELADIFALIDAVTDSETYR